ncbi:MAG: hypothetical protein LC632_08700 [Xanthomonadaceae bacterium]|nr:hypothetical protein [Xanthomonadaceae bacterium]
MGADPFENLVRTGVLHAEPPNDEELAQLFDSALARLNDATREDLSYDSRFDLAYNASHALALVALKRHGYRSSKRYVLFQLLGATAGMKASEWRVLVAAHDKRNVAEYEGALDHDMRLLQDMIKIAANLAERLGP